MADNLSSLQETTIVVKSLLLSRGGKMTIELLEADYQMMEEQRIPYGRLGYTSTETFLRSLSQLLQVRGHGKSAIVELAKDPQTQHLQDMIKEQRSDKKFNQKMQRSASRGSYGANRQRNQPGRNFMPQSPYRQAHVLPHPPQPCSNGMYYNHQASFAAQQQQFRRQQVWGGMPYQRQPPGRCAPPPEEEQRFQPNDRPQQKPKTPSPVKKPKTPSPVKKPKTPSPVKKPKTPSPVRKPPSPVQTPSVPEAKPSNSIQDPSQLPETHRKHPEPYHYSDLDDFWPTSHQSIRPPPGFENSSVAEKIAREPQISMQDSDDEFLQLVDRNISRLEQLNISSLSTQVMPSPSNSFPELDDFSQEASGESEPAFPDWVYESVHLVPKDMAGYKDEIKISNRTNVLTIGAWTEIFVSEVHNPHKFFFHSYAEQEDLEDLMASLKTFYERPTSASLTPKSHELLPGLTCAALYLHEWHRGRIVSEPYRWHKTMVVKVYYVDYGTVSPVPLHDIRFLHKRFLELPQLCHRASLSGLLPLGDTWNVEASRMFLALVMGKKLCAMANYFYATDRSWHVELVNASTTPYENINFLLIKHGMAQLYESEDLTDYLDYYKSHPPTFDELINGKYPTYSELLEWHRMGIEYDPKSAKPIIHVDNDVDDDDDDMRMEDDKTLYLIETNPFIESIRKKNIRVVTLPRLSIPGENFLSNCAKKDIPLVNVNIPVNDKILMRTNPFL
ncbi:YLP motif-containing protein 1 isoform X2 [Phlebotomus papatasi]|uniref:YLP motif-containing protein 1 isoform X2 n=1 Tax=Phlebotomus papatasi TaxID=29031 RepID=UPI002483AF21|nr:YLP motif-containing protein 1 isoform X2 [Phlebotomus papatasi]XP_055706945.1 YLP motif-containing protein 1 isoform X2 [Phlebotomus papatasi]